MNDQTSHRDAEPLHRAGICAIVGRPNVGKSTLLNRIVGEKVAIATPVPQTTRHAIRGILNRPGSQIAFVDTPGVHKPKTLLGARLNEIAQQVLDGVDVVVFLVDADKGIGRGDAYLAEVVTAAGVPVIGVVNKVDRLSKNAQLPAIAAMAELGAFDEIVPISALDGDQVELLVELIDARIPDGPPLYPTDQVTDSETATRIAELVREKAMVAMREEVPHSIAVLVEEMGPGTSEGVTAVYASIYVERDSQKGIVIGRQGAVLSQIGREARPEIEAVVGGKVYLDLRVKLMKEWQRDPRKLDQLGY